MQGGRWGQVGGGGGGPSGRLEHLASLGWVPLGLQAGARAMGPELPVQSVSQEKMGGVGGLPPVSA